MPDLIPDVAQVIVPFTDMGSLQVVIPPVSRHRGGDWHAGNSTIEDASLEEIVEGIGAHLAVYYAKQRELGKVHRVAEKLKLIWTRGRCDEEWTAHARELIELIKSED